MTTINSLPFELVEAIVIKLDTVSLLSCLLVSKSFNSASIRPFQRNITFSSLAQRDSFFSVRPALTPRSLDFGFIPMEEHEIDEGYQSRDEAGSWTDRFVAQFLYYGTWSNLFVSSLIPFLPVTLTSLSLQRSQFYDSIFASIMLRLPLLNILDVSYSSIRKLGLKIDL